MKADALERDLKRLVDGRATTADAELWPYARDIVRIPSAIRALVRSTPDAAVMPETAEEVSAVVDYCRRKGLPVVPRGAGSSGLFGSVPRRGGVVVDLRGMNRIDHIDADGETMTAGAGATWWQAEAELQRHGLALRSYPSSARSATLGGWVMTGGLGIGSLKYGPVFEHVLSAQVVLPDGIVRDYSSGEGLDLFFESEGTLGIITALTIRVRREPASVRSYLAHFADIGGLFRVLASLAAAERRPYNVEFQDAGYLSLLRAAGYETPEFGSGSGTLLVTYDGTERETTASGAHIAALCEGHGGALVEGAGREWEQRFNMLRVRRAAPSLVPCSVYLPVDRIGDFCLALGRTGRRQPGVLGYVVSDSRCSLMPMIATDEARPLEYLFAMQAPAAISKLALSLGGKPGGGVGVWNAPFRREILGEGRLAEVSNARARFDSRGTMNPGLWTEPPFLFRPGVYRLATAAGAAASRLLPLREPAPPAPGFAAELASCVQCGYCMSVCPTAQGWPSSTPRGRVLAGREELMGAGSGSKMTPDLVERLYQCTLCGRCGVDCSVDIKSRAMFQGLRAYLAGKGLKCDLLTGLTDTIRDTHNMAGKPNDRRAGWVSRARLSQDIRRKRTAEVVYFVGCVTSFFPMAQAAARAFARIMEAAGVDLGVVGGEEWCCGFPLMSAGASDAAAECVRHNVETVRAMGARTLVMTCPGCYRVWKEEYLEVVEARHGLEVLHGAELLARLLEAGRIETGALEASVTYHDPCDLGRNSGIFDEPRYVIDRLDGVELRELAENREHGSCCGSGGDLLASNQDLAMEIAGRKVQQALDTGADSVVTACPSCVRAINMARTTAKVKLGVMDLSELVLKGMGI